MFQTDRGFRQLRLSRKPCPVLRQARLCVVMAEMPSSRRLRVRHPQFAADGLLRPRAARARRTRAWDRGARGRRQCERLGQQPRAKGRSEEHTSELQSLMRISYAVFCLKKKIKIYTQHNTHI